MSNKKIHDLMDKLNKALEGLDSADVKSRIKLDSLIPKINDELDKPERSKKEDPLVAEIKDAVIHFEVKHPVIAETLSEIMMALYSIGL